MTFRTVAFGILLVSAAGAAPPSELVFNRAMQAMAASNCETALGLLESALYDDPDNLFDFPQGFGALGRQQPPAR